MNSCDMLLSRVKTRDNTIYNNYSNKKNNLAYL